MGGISFSDDTSNTNDEWFIVVDSLGCDVFGCSVGIEELTQEHERIKVYPNPAQNEITVELEGDSFNYQIVSLSGKIVHPSTHFECPQCRPLRMTASPFTINVSNLPNGYYILKVQQDNNLYSTPLIINR